MIDGFFIFTKGGLVLWSYQFVKLRGDPIGDLIKNALIEERVAETFTSFDPYNVKWYLRNDLGLFFVVIYQGILQMTYLDQLLSAVAHDFVGLLDTTVSLLDLQPHNYDARFKTMLQKVDKAAREIKRPAQMRTFEETKKGLNVTRGKEGNKGLKASPSPTSPSEEDDDDGNLDADGVEASKKKLKDRFATGKKKIAKNVNIGSPEKTDNGKKTKEKRQWAGSGKISEAAMRDLNKSKDLDADPLDRVRENFMDDEDDSSSISSLEETDVPDTKAKGLFHRLAAGVKNLTGGAKLTEEDLKPLMKAFEEELMEKNVAAEVVYNISESVIKTLAGTTTEKYTSVHATIKTTLVNAIEKILTPKKSIDVLRAALAAKAANRVYSIVFLGVNGVGKSTNLAKVAYFLKRKGNLSVMVAACDTFRAGAVEQLRTHCRCLDAHLFERGYGKDPADIASKALQHAQAEGYDVLLVDTAGRMQDNEPLMKALAKLVQVNNPDLVLFVGEALVGNDAIDQVTKFNRSLLDLSDNRAKPRGIDGMLLTKYDTVDDKVGAALSMVYVTGQPVVFVGTGQKYPNLRKLEAREVAKLLLR
eukprot:GEMP01018076.1.p1 GENE.GEMP01018076.1~~GEMP01018076.1.p1  ORF type:complete len:588 (+),score=166.88 GEMP01018076.1:26-1789(+)